MSQLLEFPPDTLPLPRDILSPPYVIFGIQGESVMDILPPLIPLNAVLHFIPKLGEYVLPSPRELPPGVAKGMLSTPYVGIDIPFLISKASLQRIIWKLLRSAGRPLPKEDAFQRVPPLLTSMSMYKCWTLLGLHPAGLDGLVLHIQMLIMSGKPLTFFELQSLWDTFPRGHVTLSLAAANFVQAHCDLDDGHEEFLAVRKWYSEDAQRLAVFEAAAEKKPEFGEKVEALAELQKNLDVVNAEKRRGALKELNQSLAADVARRWAARKMWEEDREVERTGKASGEEKKEEVVKDSEGKEEGEKIEEAEELEYLQPTVYNPNARA